MAQLNSLPPFEIGPVSGRSGRPRALIALDEK
jgi:hypothetical protein